MRSSRKHRMIASIAIAAVVGIAAGLWVTLRGDSHAGPLPHFVQTENYLPGVDADVYLPTPTTARTAVVVLIPGGAWRTADRRGLAPLADALASAGVVAVNATYRTANSGVRFPVPVTDIVCAIDYAAVKARAAGFMPGPIVVLGHSSGAQLAALAALNGAHFGGSCPYPAVAPDGLIGLAGPYDVGNAETLAYPLFGASAAAAPTEWHDGNPMTWVGERTGASPLRVLVAHGASDTTVPTAFSTSFATALEQAGHPVQLTIVPGADHAEIYRPEVIADIALAWIHGLP